MKRGTAICLQPSLVLGGGKSNPRQTATLAEGL